MSHALAAPPPRVPAALNPSRPATRPRPPPPPPCESTVDRSSSLGHTQPKGCQLLFAVHFAPFCCSSAAPFIIHRSSYCGARYNAQLQHDDGQNTPGRVVSHSVTPLRRRYEWHRGRKRVLVLSCSHARPPPPPRSSAALPRVYTRVCACRYTACTLVKIQSEHESAMGTFIVHSYVVLSALHYAIVFSTRPPSRASFNNAHYDNIPLWSELGEAKRVGAKRIPHRGFDIYIRSTSGSRETS